MARDVAGALELPADHVTVSRVKEPLSRPSYASHLNEQEQQTAQQLYSMLDMDQNGQVERKQLVALHGGDASGLFAKLQSDRNAIVSAAQWNTFVVALKVSRGEKVLAIFLRHLLRNSRALAARKQVTATLSFVSSHALICLMCLNSRASLYRSLTHSLCA